MLKRYSVNHMSLVNPICPSFSTGELSARAGENGIREIVQSSIGPGFYESGKRIIMRKTLALVTALTLTTSLSLYAQDVVHAVDGTVKKIDAGSKTVVVDTKDGTEHTFHYASDVTVDGAKDTGKATTAGLGDLKEGSKVAVHYTVVGGKETTHEIDKIGDDGLKATEGTVSHIDSGAKTIAVKTADGSVQTFHLTDRVAKDTGKDIAAGADKSAKVTVYYTEKAGTKTAHFIKAAF
jgi:hypothetical protein